MTDAPTLDACGEALLVRPGNIDTVETHARLSASWEENAAERAAVFDRTVQRKAAFHRRRLDALTREDASDTKQVSTALAAEAYWRDHEGRGAHLAEHLVTGLRRLSQTPIAQVASWAVWDERDASDAHWYERRDALTTLTSGTQVPSTGAVVVGLGAGDDADQAARSDAWATFHGGSTGGGSVDHAIRNLADHIRDTPLWGSYMTGFYKNLPNVDEQVLKVLLDAASAPDKKAMTTLMGLIIRDELAQFGLVPNHTHAIALGGRTANLARTAVREWRSVIEVPHYAAYIKPEAFRASIQDALAATHPRDAHEGTSEAAL